MANIVHLTSAHPRNDIRIYHKELVSLSKKFKCSLIVADGLGSHVNENKINIIDIGKPNSRLDRMKNSPKRILQSALKLDADLYHLHDPELLQIAIGLKKAGKIVIFDAHEDLPKQVLSRPYLNKLNAHIIAFIVKYYEKFVCSKLDAIVTATPSIQEKFSKFSKKTVDINNYPLLGELETVEKNWSNIGFDIAYVGGVSKIRGVEEVVKSLEFTHSNVRLNLVGKFNEKITHENTKHLDGWHKVIEHGQLSRTEVKKILEKSIAGIVTFLPVPNHIDAQPNKMFEYMSAGIPVIGSNYPLWKSIIEGNNCGICVDPEKPQEIAKAIDRLTSDKKLSEEMGKNGIKAVNEKYNWSIEEAKLFKLYEELLGN